MWVVLSVRYRQSPAFPPLSQVYQALCSGFSGKLSSPGRNSYLVILSGRYPLRNRRPSYRSVLPVFAAQSGGAWVHGSDWKSEVLCLWWTACRPSMH